MAENVNFLVSNKDKNVIVTKNFGQLGNLAPGEIKSFIMFMSPNNKFKSNELVLALTLSLNNQIGGLDKTPVSIAVNQKPPENRIVEFKPDVRKYGQPEIGKEGADGRLPIHNIDPAPVSNSKRPDAIAIVIGIEEYADLPKANYAQNDAHNIAEYFKKTLGINKVFTYTNDKANWIFFDNMFNLESGELKRMITPGTTDIFIYFSGHGIPSPSGEQIYLMPSDGKKDRLSSQGINVTAFYDNLQHLKARNIFIFMDACFSGLSRQSESSQSENLTGTKTAGTSRKSRDPWISNPAFYIFNSSASDGVSMAFDQGKTGLFTYYLCLGLQGEADINKDKKITTGELQEYIHDKVEQASSGSMSKQATEYHGNKEYVMVEY